MGRILPSLPRLTNIAPSSRLWAKFLLRDRQMHRKSKDEHLSPIDTGSLSTSSEWPRSHTEKFRSLVTFPTKAVINSLWLFKKRKCCIKIETCFVDFSTSPQTTLPPLGLFPGSHLHKEQNPPTLSGFGYRFLAALPVCSLALGEGHSNRPCTFEL